MRISLVQATFLALSSLPLSLAFKSITVPSTVEANVTSAFQISNDLSEGPSGFDSSFTNFRTYLVTIVPGYSETPACYLANATAINTTLVGFLVPADAGPDGTYALATKEYNEDVYASEPSSYEYSSTFILTNATGSWSAAELDGEMVGLPDYVPCTAYNCARNCTQAYYPLNTNVTSAYFETYECVAACPGVTYPSLPVQLENDCVAQTNAGPISASSICAVASSASSSASSASSSASSSSVSASSASVISASLASVAKTHTTPTPTSTSAAPKKTGAGDRIVVVQVTLISTVFASVFAVLGV